jgi:hypothetical protein
MLFSASMSPRTNRDNSWNTKSWCVEMASVSQEYLYNHSIVDLKPNQVSSAASVPTLLFLPILVVIATTAATATRIVL